MRRWLNEEIEKWPPLLKALQEAGYSKTQKMLTITQQVTILRFWGAVPPEAGN